jgi:hypothetical protein
VTPLLAAEAFRGAVQAAHASAGHHGAQQIGAAFGAVAGPVNVFHKAHDLIDLGEFQPEA